MLWLDHSNGKQCCNGIPKDEHHWINKKRRKSQIKIIIQAMFSLSQHKYSWLTKRMECCRSFFLHLVYSFGQSADIGQLVVWLTIFIYESFCVFSQWFYLFIYLFVIYSSGHSNLVNVCMVSLVDDYNARRTLEWIAPHKIRSGHCPHSIFQEIR